MLMRLTFLLLLLVGLPTAILVGMIPFAWRFEVLVGAAILLAIFAWVTRQDLDDLGLTRKYWGSALKTQLIVSGVFLLLLALAPVLGLTDRKVLPESTGFYAFYALVSSPAQEFIYRSVLFAEAKADGFNSVATFLLLMIPYVFVHVIYRDLLTLVFASVIGTVWTLSYMRNPNLAAVSLSHAVLGIVTIALGLI